MITEKEVTSSKEKPDDKEGDKNSCHDSVKYTFVCQVYT